MDDPKITRRPRRPLIRVRMVTIAFLGIATTAVSLVGLWSALSHTEEHRMGRAHDAVTSELEQLVRLPASPSSLAAPAPTAFVGLRGGWLDRPEEAQRLVFVPAEWRPVLARAISDCQRAGGRTVTETPIGEDTLVL